MNRLIQTLVFSFLFSLTGNATSYYVVASDSLPDLVITNIEVVKRKKSVGCIKFTIENQGLTEINVLGRLNGRRDNVTVRAYLSGDKELSRGDVLIDGMFVPNNFPNEGILKPGQTYEGEMKIDLRLKTKFVNVLILNVDDLGKFKESEESNNFLPIIFY